MNNKVITLVKDGTVLSDAKGEVIDLGSFGKVLVHVHVKVAANASQTLQLEHSAVDDEDAFTSLGNTIDIASTGNKISEVTGYLRYVRYKASASISTQPTLSMHIIAKEN